MFTFKSS